MSKIAALRENDAVRGGLPWVLLLLVFYAVTSHVTYLRTSVNTTVAGLETGTMYLRQKRADFCIGDMVRARSDARSRIFYGQVAAGAGAWFALTEAGYRLDGKDTAMSEAWRREAKTLMGNETEIEVPGGAVLFVNAGYDPEVAYNAWTYDVIPRENVKDRISHILLARDLSRIGEPVGGAGPDCARG